MARLIKRRPMWQVLRDVLLDARRAGTWLTVEELARVTRYHESSISSSLSMVRANGHRVLKRMRGTEEENRGTIWEYQIEREKEEK